MTMDSQQKVSRRRVANFTPDEKAFLAQLIKKWAIVESKLTDGKSIAKKKAAWNSITQEFNCNANVHKRDIATLKRAWDNMKAFTRKVRATERGHLIRTGGGPSPPTPSVEQGAIINIVEEAAPVIICEIKNAFDSDGAILCNNDKDNLNKLSISSGSNVNTVQVNMEINKIDDGPCEEVETPQKIVQDWKASSSRHFTKGANSRRPTDYIRREAVMRLKIIENKKKMEMQILKTQLEIEIIKKDAALLMLEKAKLELEIIKKQ